MNGTDQILWLGCAYGAVMIVVGFWLDHKVKVADRRVDEAEARAARNRLPAE